MCCQRKEIQNGFFFLGCESSIGEGLNSHPINHSFERWRAKASIERYGTARKWGKRSICE